ncbi:MAG: SpoIIE family protein phosphatase, partial [Crocinitomicaceae bacterium]|nr:SpoIIE family protein phosphatase [Crocinitomicaceae bacterium]
KSIHVDSNKIILGGVQGLAILEDGIIKSLNEEFHFPTTTVHTIAKDNNGTYWFGTDDGLMSFDGETLSYPRYGEGLLQKKIRSIIIDKFSNLWIAIGENIVVYSNGKFNKIKYKSNFISHTIYSMCFDNDNYLWIGRQNGLDRLLIKDFAVESNRSYEDGKGFMASECNNSAISIFENSKILIGTNQGLLTLDKNYDQINPFETKTEITAIKLFSQKTNWSEFSDSINEKGFPVNLNLSFRENYFTFHFIGITHRNPSAVRYKYKLEGFDKDWINAEKNRLATYSNLPFGTYNFQVKSSNDEGIWNKSPVEFSFIITPPFWRTWWFYTLCALAVLFVIVSYYQIRISNIKIKRRNEKINQQNEIIEEKNQEIVDSITYAKRIQDAILPSSMISKELPNCFVHYQPKDIVSGDFYWMKTIGEKLLIAAVDCTGHGVPGGFVSMVGYSGLNRAVSEYQLTEPADILEKLSELVTESFDDGSNTGIKDGMDAAICYLDQTNLKLHFSGANNPLYIIRHNNKPLKSPSGELIEVKSLEALNEIKGTRRPVGSSDYKQPFVNKEIQLEKDDIIYLFSDGYPDQFGGPRGKKLMYKPFKRILLENSRLPMHEQKEKLELEFNSWSTGYAQIDDICIIGIKV